jgi:DNA-binding PadR family transcriptional regulator
VIGHDDIERLAALHEAARSGGIGGYGRGAFGGGRGRRRRGDVRAALLLLLAEEPRNGYQLMQEIEDRSRGRWRPSPGSVYPTLQQLEDEGLIRPVDVEGTKLFELTDAGREHIASRHHAPPWNTEEDTQTMGDMKQQLKQIHIAAAQVIRAGDEEQVRRAAQALAEARRTMYRILADDDEA